MNLSILRIKSSLVIWTFTSKVDLAISDVDLGEQVPSK